MSDKLSEHFSRSEFECPCGCGFDTVDVELLDLCEHVRILNGNIPLHVNSGCRCPKHNHEVGGTKHSQHKLGRAADLRVNNPKEIYDQLCQIYEGRFGFGIYKNFIHVDSRSHASRWDGRL